MTMKNDRYAMESQLIISDITNNIDAYKSVYGGRVIASLWRKESFCYR